MSDYEEDSFESESDPESGEREEERTEPKGTVQSLDQQAIRDAQYASLFSSPRFSSVFKGNGSNSEGEDSELSRSKPA